MLIKGVLLKFMQVDIYNIAHIINQPKRLQFSMVRTKHAQ
jgi:hypothetical protein